MDTLSFFRLVTPEQGEKCIVEIEGISTATGRPVWFHTRCDTHEQMVSWSRHIDKTEKPVYFALSGFEQGSVQDYAGRLQSNARWVRSFWIDVDVDANNSKKYAKKSEAGENIELFARSLNLPSPLIVVSGGGLHVYWPLDRDYSVAEWKPVAQALKVRAVEFGLKFDPTRTADAASVLRPPGTHNRKHGKVREVVALDWTGECVTLQQVADATESVVGIEVPAGLPLVGLDLPALSLTPEEQISANITNIQIQPRSAEKVFQSCRQMAIAQRDMQFGSDGLNTEGKRGDKVVEPVWVAGITVLNRCENAHNVVHVFSKPYPGYSYQETEDKRLRFPDSPATCGRFNELNPSGCKGCRFAGKITSPIELGVEIVEAETPVLKIESEAVIPITIGGNFSGGFETEKLEREITLVQPGRPYKRSAEGVYVSEKTPKIDPISGETIEGQFTYEDTKLTDHDIYPLFQTDQKSGGYSTFHIKWRVVPVKHPELARDVLIPRGKMMDEQGLLAKLAGDTQFSPHGEKEGKRVVQYMRYYLSAFQQAPIQEVVNRFGWENSDPELGDLSFIYGRTRMSRSKQADGTYKVDNESVLPGVHIEGMADLFKVNGSVEGWAEAARFYEKNGSYKHILGILCGLGSPFMTFTGERSGLVVMRGPGGCGKSKVQELVAAAWGGAKSHLMMAGDATLTARMIHMGTMHHLPILAEDIKDMPDADISRFIMDAANGEERMRGATKEGATVLQERRSWCTTTLVSTNIDWRGRIDAAGTNNEGQNRRLLQIDMDPMQHVDAADGRALERLLLENTGAIGPLLVRQWMEDPVASQAKLDSLRVYLMESIIKIGHERRSPHLMNFNANEMSILVAPILTALWVLFRLRNKMGLVTWEPARVIETVCDILEQGIDAMRESRQTAEVLLSDFLDEHRGKIVFNTPSGLVLNIPGAVGQDFAPIRTPVQDVVGRVDSVKGDDTLSLSVNATKRWLRAKSVSFREFQKMLTSEGFAVETGRNVKAALTKGCPGDTKSRTYVIRIINFSYKEKQDGTETTS